MRHQSPVPFPEAARHSPAMVAEPSIDGESGQAYSPLTLREDQMHPCFSAAEIARVRAFGVLRRWRTDDYVVRTGDAAAGMVVILKGRVRVLQRDGFDRTTLIAEHGPGYFMGDIGQLAGRPQLVDGIALEDVEALVIAPERLRAVMVAEAELGERIMRALILRRTGLIERGRGPTLFGHSDEPRVLLLQAFLRRNNHPHTVIDIDKDADALHLLSRTAFTSSDLPLVVCPGGTVLRRPDTGQLASCLGLLPEFQANQVYDVAVVGAGPAGLATAVYAASEGLCVTVLDSLSPGGQAGASSRIENYLGFPTGVSGQSLASRAYAQAQKFGAHIAIPLEVTGLECGGQGGGNGAGNGRDRHGDAPQGMAGGIHRIMLKDGRSVSAKTVVIASGAAYRRPPIPRLADFEGRGVYYWASPVEARLCARQEVVLVGGGNSAGQAAVYLATHAAHVHVVIRGPGLEQSMSRYLIDRIASQPNITVHPHRELTELHGDCQLREVTVRDRTTDTLARMAVRHVFLFTGAEPNTGWLQSCHIDLDAKGFVLTGRGLGQPGSAGAASMETSVPGVFAVGDVRSGSTKRVATAVGEGAAVVSQIHAYLTV
ncbi:MULTISPECIES: FAD-dependent oxidoreductase [unclassified Cupriavidus]|uniref:FAD-dependent oxidoreductase n=1 Tax=Cupriavidus sp. H19C3 TaxID=3241603 RepID=UPI003BF8B595